jgi:hypothetical protein
VRGSFHDWIRVIVNLAKNSNIDRDERLVAALCGSKQLSLRSGADFLSCIANDALDESGGFNQQQQREERLKAQLILRNTGWRPLIERAETHPYFRGDIEFLLRFSGVYDRAVRNRQCDWSDEEGAALWESFADWYHRVCFVFPENATAWPVPFPDFYGSGRYWRLVTTCSRVGETGASSTTRTAMRAGNVSYVRTRA